MAGTKKRFSAIAGVSLLSGLFLILSYAQIKAPVSSQNIAVQKDLVSSEENGALYQSMNTQNLLRDQSHVNNTKSALPQAVHFKDLTAQHRNQVLNNHLFKYGSNKYNIKPAISSRTQKTSSEEESSAEVTSSAGKLSGRVVNSGRKQNSIEEDRVYDGQVTTASSLEDRSVTDQYNSAPGDIENRKYQYWLSNDPSLPYNTSLVTQQQVARHKRIQQTCELPEVRDVLFNPREGHRSLISSYKNLLYCPILKAGSTNMLRLLCWLYGPPCSTIKNLLPHNMVPHFLTRASKIAIGNNPQFLSYFSFALVRNPWRRLVSVYIQKFVETKQGLGFCDVKHRFPALYRYHRQHRDKKMSFKDYIEKCVIGQHKKGGILAQNGHWRPQYHMCSFCFLDFTFIGKIETMKSDERVILNAFGFDDIDQTIADANSHLLPNEKANKTTLLYEDLWAQISDRSLTYLKKLYRIDLEMFNYPTHPLQKDTTT